MMKKLTAMLLALCMLLAVLPALADSAAGNWYMTLADVTAGYIQLAEDGTATVSIASQEASVGTWTEGDGVVTITINGAGLDFAYDGTTLVNDMFPLPLSREEGKLSMDLISKMMSGEEYTLPDGMTEEDMTAIAINFLAEYTKIMESASGSESTGTAGGTEEPAAAAEKPELTILKEDFRVIESYSRFDDTYIAKVQNNTDAPLFLTGGSLKVMDESGNVVAEETYLGTSGSKYLEPGEISFVSMRGDLDENIPVTWEAHIEAEKESYRDTDIIVKAENAEFRKKEGEYGDDYMAVTVTNETDQPLARIEAVLVLEDAEGGLLALNTESLYYNELGAGSTITLVSPVSSKVMEYCQANGIEPAAVEAFAWVENR